MYVMVCTRPDLVYAVSTVSQFMSNPRKATSRSSKVGTLRYLRGTVRLGLVFYRLKTRKSSLLQNYVDADYARDLDQ